MAHKQHAPSDAPAKVDPIAALYTAIVQAAEQNWQVYGTPEPERVRLRPGVLAVAKEATDRLRAEHAMRAGRP